MQPDSNEDLRAELAAIVSETKRHTQWLADSGVSLVRKDVAPAAAPAAQRSPTVPMAMVASSTLAPPTRPPLVPPSAARPLVPAGAPLVPAGGSIFGSKPAASMTPATSPEALLKVIRDDLGDCRRCGLCEGRHNIVFGQGSAMTEVLFLGEGPGEDEDKSGLAFVGAAGQLLTKIIDAMGFSRDTVYICNIVKCRPPGNRKPEPAEIEKCQPFVERQIRAIKPKVIVALGATAAQSLLRTKVGITQLRNTWQVWEGIPVMPTFHPSYLLRKPEEKGKVWDDLKLVVAKAGRELPKKKGSS